MLAWLPVVGVAQTTTFSFDDGKTVWTLEEGKATVTDTGAYKGKALKMSSGTLVRFKLPLQPASTYRLTAWLRTESGADNMSMQIVGLREEQCQSDHCPCHLDEVRTHVQCLEGPVGGGAGVYIPEFSGDYFRMGG